MIRLLNIMVAQVTLDRNGIDPGFTDMYRISVTEVMEGVSEELAAENDDLKMRLEQMQSLRTSDKDEIKGWARWSMLRPTEEC